jgi:hypothetical protein
MTTLSSPSQIQAFLERRKAEETSRARLIFALDATMSRQPTWDRAAELQAEMFRAAGTGIDVQLVYFRGTRPGECRASPWLRDPAKISAMMAKINCQTGYTQIGRVLAHALREADKMAIRAVVFVGDAFEEEIDSLGEQAAALGKRGIPIFMFQEADDETAAAAFREIAKLSNGICAQFDHGSAKQLADLMRTVGKFAAQSGDAHLALSEAREALTQKSILLLR